MAMRQRLFAAEASMEPTAATVPQHRGPLQGRPQASGSRPKIPGPNFLGQSSLASAAVGPEARKQRLCVTPRALIEGGIAAR